MSSLEGKMDRHQTTATIRIKKITKADLDGLGQKGETYDQIIRKLFLSFTEKYEAASKSLAEKVT